MLAEIELHIFYLTIKTFISWTNWYPPLFKNIVIYTSNFDFLLPNFLFNWFPWNGPQIRWRRGCHWKWEREKWVWIKRAFHPPIRPQRNHKLPTHYPNPHSFSIHFFPSFRPFSSPRASAHSPHDTTPQYHSLTQGQFFLVPTKTNPNQTPSSFSHKNKKYN